MTANALPVRDREPGPQRFREMAGNVGWGILAWVVGIAFFLPVLWMMHHGVQAGVRRRNLAAQVHLQPDPGGVPPGLLGPGARS